MGKEGLSAAGAADNISGENYQLRELMNDSPGGYRRMLVAADGRHRTVYMNDSFCRLLGMSYEQIMERFGADATAGVHPDDVELVRSMSNEMLSSGKTRNFRYRQQRGDGSYIWLLTYGRASRSESGETFLNTYFADMSEQHQDMTQWETLPYLLSAIMEYSTDLVFAKDKDFRYICCSPAFVKFTRQKSESDVIGKTDYDFWTKEEADHFRGDDMRLYESGQPLIDYIEPIPSDDGIQHYCSTSKYLLRDAAGAVIGMYGIGRDITEYRNAFDQLKLLTNSIPGGIATYANTPDGVKLTYFNDGFCKMFGYSREEYEHISARGTMELAHEDDRERVREQVRALLDHDIPLKCTFRVFNRLENDYRWVDMRGAISGQRGENCLINTVLFDVTESKQAEETARIHEQEMWLAMSQMGKMICEYEVAGGIMTMPEDYARRYNAPQTLTNMPAGKQYARAVDKEFHQAYEDFFAAIQRGEKVGAFEYSCRWADGSRHWERADFSTVFSSDGRPIKAIIAIEDTTAQHMQYELEQNRPKLGEDDLLIHALFNLSSGETLDYTYRDGSEVPLHERIAFTYGGAGLDKIVINEQERQQYRELNDRERLLQYYEQGRTELSLDYRRRMPDGDAIWVRNVLRMVRQPGGSDILLFEYCYNIEEQKTRELITRALVNENFDYVARINGKSGRFVIMANTGVQYGMPPQQGDDLDKTAQEVAEKFVHPDDREHTIRNTTLAGIEANLAGRERFQFTSRLVRPDGEVRYKKFTEFFLDRERDIIILIREDVSSTVLEEMHKNELLADALAAANQASRAKTQFLSRMSHELRTPMNAIIGLAALSASEVHDPERMADSIAKIGMSARYLLSLINDILEMSRIESGRMTLHEAPFEFRQLITDVNTIIYPQAAAKGVDYDVVINSFVEPVYLGDATKLQEIMVNILGNAVKFTPAGGKVTMSIEQLRCVNKCATLRFVVNDTGVGIESQFLPHLFDPFAQEISDLSSSISGTGLGLAITKNLVELMNGQISVQSIKNVGSVFTVEVQLGVSEQSQHYLDMVSAMNLNHLSVLVVDDDVTICQSTGNILLSMGLHAEWVNSGWQAVERVRQTHQEQRDFDTIFIDWKMPDLDGIETARHIRRIVGPEVTIIIMTAFDWRAIETQAREAGVDMFMEKPLFQSSIAQALEKIYFNNAPQSELREVEPPDLSGCHILLAEDHPLNVEVAKRLLEKVGAEVTVASNGLEAMEIYTTAADGHFDAILMDVQMPVMDGLAAARNIRNLRKSGSQDIPIIAMTANAFDEDVEKSLHSGMDAHLAKPVEPSLLFSTLKRLLKP